MSVQAQERQQRQVSNNGLQVHYRECGSGVPLVILSGGPGFDCDCLLPLAQQPGQGDRAIRVDLCGTGRSVPPLINRGSVNLKLTLRDPEAVREQTGHAAQLPSALRPAYFHVETANIRAADLLAGAGGPRPGLKDFSRPVRVIAGRQDPRPGA